jgi:error-prone DNA polymerase
VDRFGAARVVAELTYAREPMADERFSALAELARRRRLRLVATTAAHYHSPGRPRLATVAAAVRARRSLDDMDGWLPAWADVQLRSPGEMLDRFRHHPDAVAAAADLAQELAFDLALVAPRLPPFDVPAAFADEITFPRHLVAQGAVTRYGPSAGDGARAFAQLEHELTVIEQLGFAGYLLVVWDLSQFCGQRGILAQGRGSAANSVVCYVLGVTAVDPIRYGLLFERFLSAERDGPPDIDIDIESGRREEVIQYVYAKHGRGHAA